MLKQLLKELKFEDSTQMIMICDNQAALHVVSDLVFHEKTKHIKVDCHFMKEKIEFGETTTILVNTKDKLANIFTESLRGPTIDYICYKLGVYYLYAPLKFVISLKGLYLFIPSSSS